MASSTTAADSSGTKSISTSELSVMVSVIVVGVLVLALVTFSAVKYYNKLSRKYRQAMEITGDNLDAYSSGPQNQFINDVDLDKLNYIADVSEVQR